MPQRVERRPVSHGTTLFPAAFRLVSANTGCPCGHYGDPTRACTCPEAAASRYKKRLSGPLMDRGEGYPRHGETVGAIIEL